MKLQHSKKLQGYTTGFTEQTDTKEVIHLIVDSNKTTLIKIQADNILKALRKYNTVVLNSGSKNKVNIWYEKDYDMTSDYFKYGECKSKFYNIVQHTYSEKTDRHVEHIVKRRKNPLYGK